ncbi:MAG: acyl-CoA synthetase FdrA [Chloroflexota bacterium]|nr:acyl-CoA synthetase FdrA [Chloroflexota bacterium]
MKITNLVKRNRYQDSVTLMQVAVKLRELAGMDDVALMMGTAPNLELMREAGLLDDGAGGAGPNDLVVALRGTEQTVEAALSMLDDLLRNEVATSAGGQRGEVVPHNLSAGLAELPEANLVLISTPGIYAAAEARKALLHGKHVMVFSDNVSIEDEVALKGLAAERGLLLMGPDCGTAVIGGVPLGFANMVRRGKIGVVGASGTGMQEVTSLIDRYGGGISHAIGTGSRDLSRHVRAEMTVAGLRALLADPATEVVVVVSKPPSPAALDRVLAVTSDAEKPVVLMFVGMRADSQHCLVETEGSGRQEFASTLEEAARVAVRLAYGRQAEGVQLLSAEEDAVNSAIASLKTEQRYLRGLFSGGTFCYEAMWQMQGALDGPVYSNTPISPEFAVPNAHISQGHTCLDLGSDEFTVGRPHPMIDFSTRTHRLLQEAADPSVAVLLLDVVLGFGAHPDPAGELAPAIRRAMEFASNEGRTLPVVVHICGTEGDPQGLEKQRQTLLEAGAIIAPSNAAAAQLAARIANRSRG